MTVPSEPTKLLKETIQENFLHNGLGDGFFNIMSKAWEAKVGKWVAPNNKKISKILLCIATGITEWQDTLEVGRKYFQFPYLIKS